MKKYILYVLAMSIITSFIACNDDDKAIINDVEKAKSYAGFYRGKMNVHVDDANTDEMWQQAELGVVEDNIYLRIESFWIKDIKFGNFRVPNLTAYESEGGLNFSGLAILSFDNISNVNVEVEGVIKNNKMNLNFSIKSVSIPPIYSSMEEAVMRDTIAGERFAQILSLNFDDERLLLQPEINEKNKAISVFITDTITSPVVKLKPQFVLSDGATIDIDQENDSINFVSGSVKFTVLAPDQIHRYVYTARIYKAQTKKYDLDTWTLAPSDETNADMKYSTPSDPTWQTDNESLRYLKGLGLYETAAPYLVEETPDAVSKQAAKITNKYVAGATPTLQVGLLYTGEQLGLNISDPLPNGRYGTPFATKPIKLLGSYKYTAGANFYNNGIIDTSITDSCLISAVLYEIESNDDYLNGTNLFTDDKVVALGAFIGSSTSEYINFEMNLSYIKSYYFSKKYKLAIVCTPSRYGFWNQGAENSTLWVDELQIISQDNYR